MQSSTPRSYRSAASPLTTLARFILFGRICLCTPRLDTHAYGGPWSVREMTVFCYVT
jgi:hypothetical protein